MVSPEKAGPTDGDVCVLCRMCSAAPPDEERPSQADCRSVHQLTHTCCSHDTGGTCLWLEVFHLTAAALQRPSQLCLHSTWWLSDAVQDCG